MKNGYSKDDYELAKKVSLIDYLNSNWYSLRQTGNRVYLNPHDSLCIDADKNVWFWFAQNTGGNIIDFLMKYENLSIVEAVQKLSKNTSYEKREFTKYIPVENTTKGDLKLPTKYQDNKRV